jgi:S-DNA-T family DNA segregation ATPase FtsK/SpoIIIE
VKSVAEVVKDNVKKATDVFGEAVGVKVEDVEDTAKNSEEIVDGIIESVLEPPKKAVGQVVTNEELDALIPESLEAMSTDEIADLEERKAEEERLELEALEAQLKLEEEKKAKSRLRKLSSEDNHGGEAEGRATQLSDEEYAQLKEQFLATMGEDTEEQPLDSLGFIKVVQSDVDAKMEEEIPDTAGILRQMIDNKEFYTGEDSTKFESKSSYENHGFEVEDYELGVYEDTPELKPTHTELYDNSFGDEEDVPTVEVIFAQEDIIDFSEIIPEAVVAQEESIQKETVHGKLMEESAVEQFVQEESVQEELTEEPVMEQFVQEELVQEELTEEPVAEKFVQEESVQEVLEQERVVEQSIWEKAILEETIQKELTEEPIAEQPAQEKLVQEELTEEPIVEQSAQEEIVQEELTEEPIAEQSAQEEIVQEELTEKSVVEDLIQKYLKEETPITDTFTQEMVTEESDSNMVAVDEVGDVHEDKRQLLRVRILITEDMTRKLRDLKESR